MVMASQPIKILHVDDDVDFLKLTKLYLEKIKDKKNPLQVSTLSNPLKAIETLSYEKFDIIISDYQMPIMDGITFFEKLKEKNVRIPFIIFTGKSREEIAIKALNLGIDHYIIKGIDVESQFKELSHTIFTEMKYQRTEKALELSESKSQAMLEAIPDLIFTMDRNGFILTYKADLDDLIVEPIKFLGKTVNEVLPKELGNKYLEFINKTLSTGKLQSFEYSLPIKGKIRFREARMSPISDNEVIIIVRDQTEKVQMQRELKTKFDEYYFVFENSPALLWLEDFSKFKSYIAKLKENNIIDFREYFENNPGEVKNCLSMVKVMDVNKTALKLFSAKQKEDLLGNVDQFLNEDSYEAFKEELITLAEGKTEFTSTSIRHVLDNQVKYFNIHLRIPDGYKDTYNKVLISGMDTTHLKEAEIKLIQKTTELSDFAHFMSHDLNNSIMFMSHWVEMLQEKFNPIYLEKMQNKIIGMKNLLNKSLVLADAGLIINKNQEIDLNQIVTKIADTIISKDILFSHDQLPTISGDYEKISQIFSNILENAVFHGNPTKISVNYSRNISTHNHVITISNNGIKINQEDIDKIFDRGFSTKGNTGLGLSIVKKLVEAHGWQIKILSDLDNTSFIITIN